MRGRRFLRAFKHGRWLRLRAQFRRREGFLRLAEFRPLADQGQIVPGRGVLWIETQRCREIVPRLMLLTVVQMTSTAQRVSARVLGVQTDGGIAVRDGLVERTLEKIRPCSVVKVTRVARIVLNRLREVVDGPFKIAFFQVAKTSPMISESMVGTQPNRLGEVSDSAVHFSVVESATTEAIDAEVLRIEPDGLGQIGDGWIVLPLVEMNPTAPRVGFGIVRITTNRLGAFGDNFGIDFPHVDVWVSAVLARLFPDG